MSAAEMREAAAKLAARWRADMVERHGEEAGLFADRIEAAIRATPLPSDDEMVERVAKAIAAVRLDLSSQPRRAGKSYAVAEAMARAAIRAINGGEP